MDRDSCYNAKKYAKYEWILDMKNVQEHDFCSKNDQIMATSKKPSILNISFITFVPNIQKS
jgi:hypothetical protein